MTSREEGFLLLCGRLGNPGRRPLTPAQLKQLSRRVAAADRSSEDKEMELSDLLDMGCSEELAGRILSLLSDHASMQEYLARGRANGCRPLTRLSSDYPQRLLQCLDWDAPACLWFKGDHRLLNRPAVALVGNRDLEEENECFAREIGLLAARMGYVLISGNARGADTVAQESCLRAGGGVICVVADRLYDKPIQKSVLYLSEEGFDLSFTSQRALSRNRLIHCMGQKTFVAQCQSCSGGTWDGTYHNLKGGWSPVFCISNGSEGILELQKMGATAAEVVDLHKILDE